MSAADAIRDLLRTKASALVAKSPDALAGLIDPAFIYINARGSRFSKEEYVAAYCRSGTIRFLEQTLDDIEVMEFDGFAVASMTIRDRFEQQGAVTEGRYRSLGVFRKGGDRWLWVAGQTSSM